MESWTRVSLLQRLAQDGKPDEAAWREFAEHYGDKVYHWCCRWGLQEADARDVTQRVLLKLLGRMRRFRYDPAKSFRAWLKTVTRRAWQDFQAERGRPGRGSGDSGVLEALLRVEARDDLVQQLQEQFDMELLQQAMLRVQPRVAPHTWEAFRLTAVEGLPAAEVGRRLHMSVVAVYQARCSVQRRLREERRRLEQGPPAEGKP